jgi:hypothetical protein
MNLLLIVLGIFAGVALMAVVSRRFAGSGDSRRLGQMQRWLLPLVGLMLVLSLVKYYV